MHKFIKDLSNYAIFSLVERGAPFMIVTLYTYYLTTSEIGILANIDVLLTLILSLSLLNIDWAVAIEYYNPSSSEYAKYFSSGLLISAISSLLLFLILVVFRKELGFFFVIPEMWILAMIFIAFGRSIYRVLLTFLQITKKSLFYGIITMIFLCLNSLLGVILIIWKDMGIRGVLTSYIFGSFTIIVLAILFFYKQELLKFDFRCVQPYKDILKFSLPLLPLNLAHIIINSSDRFFISYFVGLEELGIYHIGYTIGSSIFLLNTIYEKAWTPYFFERIEDGSTSSVLTISKVAVIYIVGLAFSLILLLVVSKVYFSCVVSKEYESGFRFVFLVALSYFFFGFYQLYSQIMFYHKKTKSLLLISVLVILLNIGLNYLLIPYFGAIGAIYSTVFTFFILALFSYSMAKELFKYKWKLALMSLINR